MGRSEGHEGEGVLLDGSVSSQGLPHAQRQLYGLRCECMCVESSVYTQTHTHTERRVLLGVGRLLKQVTFQYL